MAQVQGYLFSVPMVLCTCKELFNLPWTDVSIQVNHSEEKSELHFFLGLTKTIALASFCLDVDY